MTDIKQPLEKQVDKLREPFRVFVGAQTTASGFLLLALIAALIVANSPLAATLRELQHFRLGLIFGSRHVEWSLLHLVNDGLIALFFFLIGLEVKRELLAGELRDGERVGLLMFAAMGGMMVPAGLYLALNLVLPQGTVDGWGIPMATDTAIAIGVLAALAARVPRSAVAFLVGVAIVDDIGAILVIAFFYTEQLQWSALLLGAALLAALLLLNQAGVRHPALYAALGIALWVMIVRSGIHASIAGVVVAATVPARPRLAAARLRDEVESAVAEVPADAGPEAVLAEAQPHQQIAEVERLARAGTTPLRRWEDSLALPVALLVLPLFAFLNAGVVIDREAIENMLTSPVALGVLAGLLLGKPVGLLGGVWICERLGLARRPEELTNRRLLGLGLLAGVGFTMSTFIAQLALASASEELESAKLAIVAASALAAACGFWVLRGSAETTDRE